ncbi:MAG: hypothetical protein IPK58_13680 [Acidobacteria bacterium]|nr:hypothetical protein [Acidobacteriota bacterium]
MRTYDEGAGTLTLDVEQTQIVDEVSPEPYEFDVNIEFAEGNARRSEKLSINKRQQSFTFKVASKPGKILFDPELKVPLLQVREK